MRVAAEIPGHLGRSLQRRIHEANEPIELWLMRAAVISGLPSDHPYVALHRREINQALARLFPASTPEPDPVNVANFDC